MHSSSQENPSYVAKKNKYFQDLIESSTDFCLLIDHIDLYTLERWLTETTRSLASIQSAMTYLDGKSDLEYSFFILPDLEERFELYCKLKKYLGNQDTYRLEFDSSSDTEEMTGSLAGDFADIYYELKRGLNLFDSNSENQPHTLTLLQIGYIMNWGQHLLDAQKHLFSLRVAGQF